MGFMVVIIRLRAVVLVVSGLGVSGCVGNCTCCSFVFGLFGCDGLVLLEVVWVCRA